MRLEPRLRYNASWSLLPGLSKPVLPPSFDVAFSFAGEQREYVESTYNCLQRHRITVFYDKAQTASLWGKNLYEYVTDIYQNKARFCVVFLSRDYAKKLWTKHELKSMQARAFRDSREYILPRTL
jgi:hypothetical protein